MRHSVRSLCGAHSEPFSCGQFPCLLLELDTRHSLVYFARAPFLNRRSSFVDHNLFSCGFCWNKTSHSFNSDRKTRTFPVAVVGSCREPPAELSGPVPSQPIVLCRARPPHEQSWTAKVFLFLFSFICHVPSLSQVANLTGTFV